MFCSKCGYKLTNDSRYCLSCGQKVAETQSFSVSNTVNDFGVARKSFRDLRRAGWNQIRGNIFTIWGVSIVWMFITFTLNFITFGFASFLIPGPQQLGRVANENRMFRGQPADFDTGFSGLGRFADALITYLLTMVFLLLWFFLFIIPGIIKSYSYALTFYILHENPNFEPTECITQSRRMMNGNKFRMFLHDIWFLIVMLVLGTITFGIALIWIIPFYHQTRYNFYKNLARPTNQTI